MPTRAPLPLEPLVSIGDLVLVLAGRLMFQGSPHMRPTLAAGDPV